MAHLEMPKCKRAGTWPKILRLYQYARKTHGKHSETSIASVKYDEKCIWCLLCSTGHEYLFRLPLAAIYQQLYSMAHMATHASSTLTTSQFEIWFMW